MDPADIDETPARDELPAAHVVRLARRRRHGTAAPPGRLILAADTIVACGRRILPKAEDEATARACLSLLSGRRHRVYGGRRGDASGETAIRRVVTQVAFKRLSKMELDAYLATGEWHGKAGGYAIQARRRPFRWIAGSYSNVVGLPLSETAQPRRPRLSVSLRRDLVIGVGPGEWRAAWSRRAAAELHVGAATPPSRQRPPRPGGAAGAWV